MNTQTRSKPHVAPLVEWLEARGFAVDPNTGKATRNRLTFAVGTTIAYIWGAQDAASGLVCVPEMHFVHRRDQREYAAGFASVAGHNETTRQFIEE